MSRDHILVINPGSTSTKVAVFKGDIELKNSNISHSSEGLGKDVLIIEQYEYRLNLIYAWLEKEGIGLNSLGALVARGGLLKPVPGGTYLVTDTMVEDLRAGDQGEHASNLGGLLARGIADKEGIKAYIVDPVSVDEFEDVSRISGLKEIDRRSQVHALNIKAVSHRRAGELGRPLASLNFLVAHLGGGISICPVKEGRMIDVNNAAEMGPFSPERTGGLPVGDLLSMCFSGEYSLEDMKLKIKGQGGLASYLGTTDAREVEEKVSQGDKYAKLIYDAMIYQIGKEIGAYGVVLNGAVDNIILTGGLAYSDYLVDKIREMVGFMGEIVVYPGENEMLALNQGVLRIINKEEEVKIYEDEVMF